MSLHAENRKSDVSAGGLSFGLLNIKQNIKVTVLNEHCIQYSFG